MRWKNAGSEQGNWPAEESHGIGVLLIDCLQPQWHSDFKFNPISGFPVSAERLKLAPHNLALHSFAIDGHTRIGIGPGRNSQIDGKVLGTRQIKSKFSCTRRGIAGLLSQRASGSVL